MNATHRSWKMQRNIRKNYWICPEVFQMTGILAVAVPGELPPDTVPTAVEAAQACPVSAITISE